MEQINDRIEWLRVRARVARAKGNEILADELDETADMLQELATAIRLAIDSNRVKYLIEALS